MKTRILFLTILFISLFSLKSKADTYYWTGGGADANWTNKNNWADVTLFGANNYPSTNDDAYISAYYIIFNQFNGSQQPTVNSPITCRSLTIANSGTAVTLTVSNTLNVTGAITIGASATITGASTITGTSLAFSAAATLTEGAAMTINGALTTFNGTTNIVNFVNNASTSPVLKITGGGTIGSYSSSGISFTASSGSTGTATINGNITLNGGGAGDFSVGSGVTLNLVSSGISTGGYGGGTFTNAGTITADASSPISLTAMSTFNNSGSLTTNAAVSFKPNSGAGTYSNSGTIISNSTMSFNSNFTNTGPITANGAMTFSGGTFSNTNATITGNANMTFTGGAFSNSAGTLIIKNGSTFSTSTSFTSTGAGFITISAASTLSAVAVTTSATINSSGASTISTTGGFTNTGSITLATASPLTTTLNFNNSGTINASGASNISNAANSSSFTNTGTITLTPSASAISTLTISGSGVTFSNTYTSAALPGKITLTGIASVTSPLFTISANGGPINNTGTISATNAAILWSGNSIATMNNTSPGSITLAAVSPFTISNGTTFTNTGTITADLSPITFNGGTTFANTGGSLTLTTTSPFSMNSGGTLTNTGTISATASPFNMGTTSNGVNITNTNPGSISLLSGSTFNYPGNSASFTNTGAVTVTSSNMNFTGNANSWTNTSPGNVVISGSAMAFSTGCGITNNSLALFTVKGGSVMTFNDGTSTSFINNYGFFNAGITNNSSCQITSGTNTSFLLTNNSGATFNLGSTSNITFKNTRSSPNCSVNNSGTFTLESDQYGSASIGQSGTTPSTTPALNNQFTGNFNVQRYISGGSGNRGYRLLSIPVNISSNTIGDLNGSGTGNISFANLNSKTTTVVNGNAVVGTVTFPGAYTGGPSGGFSTVNANPTLYVYDETKTTSTNTFTSGKTIGIASISGSTVKTLTGTTTGSSYISLPVTTGFMLYFIGDANRTTTASTPVPENTTITSIGTLNQANITFKLWNTSATTMSFGGPEAPATGKKGFNLVGNPYPCTIDLHQLWLDNSSSTGWVNFTVVKSLGANQTFATYNAYTGFQSDPTLFTQYVPSGAAFFIQATTGSQTVTFKEDIKTTSVQIGTSTTPPLLMSTPKRDILASTSATAFNSAASLPFSETTQQKEYQVLHLKLEKDSTLNDWCAIAFDKAFDDKYDNNDAYDMDGFAPKVFMSSFTADGIRTAINGFGDLGTGKKVKLYVKATTDGMYSLQMPDVKNIDLTQYKINLIDNYKRDSLDIGKYQTYNFNITNADTSTFGGNRFVLSIQQLPGAKYQLTKFTAQKAADGIFLNWVTKNEGSNYFFTLEKQQANGTDYAPLYTTQGDGSGSYKYTDKIPAKGNNTYRLKQVDLLGNITYSDLISIDYDKSGNNNMFSVYPNPTAETLNVNVTYGKNTTTASGYKLNIYDATGSLVMQKTSDNTAWSENVGNFKPGIYIVELKGNDGYSLGKAKFVKK